MLVHVRFFAAAKAAAGLAEADYELPAGASIADVLAAVDSSDPDAPRVFARCSFIVNGHATRNASQLLADGDRVDILPPFAGG